MLVNSEYTPINIGGFVYEIRALKPWHFLESGGVPVSVFASVTREVGKFAQMQADMQAKEEVDELTPEDRKMRHDVLEQAVRNYDRDIVELRGMDHFTALFSVAMGLSCKTFQRVFKPDNVLLLQCHYLARNYGGKPFDYATSDIDEFMFNLAALNIGNRDEEINSSRKK